MVWRGGLCRGSEHVLSTLRRVAFIAVACTGSTPVVAWSTAAGNAVAWARANIRMMRALSASSSAGSLCPQTSMLAVTLDSTQVL